MDLKIAIEHIIRQWNLHLKEWKTNSALFAEIKAMILGPHCHSLIIYNKTFKSLAQSELGFSVRYFFPKRPHTVL